MAFGAGSGHRQEAQRVARPGIDLNSDGQSSGADVSSRSFASGPLKGHARNRRLYSKSGLLLSSQPAATSRDLSRAHQNLSQISSRVRNGNENGG